MSTQSKRIKRRLEKIIAQLDADEIRVLSFSTDVRTAGIGATSTTLTMLFVEVDQKIKLPVAKSSKS